MPTILARGALLLPLEDARLVPVDVGDIAKAAFALLTTPGHEAKIYAMSGPEALSMEEVAEQISAAVGRPCATSASLGKRESRRCWRPEFLPFR